MKSIILSAGILVTLFSCTAKTNPGNLPKDISEKPGNAAEYDAEAEQLRKSREEIEALIAAYPCSDATQWRSTPIGSKPCGGPAGYIAYPIKEENEILPKIQEYTKQQSAFNKKRNLLSDCAYVMPPSGIKCENNKVVLIKDDGKVTL